MFFGGVADPDPLRLVAQAGAGVEVGQHRLEVGQGGLGHLRALVQRAEGDDADGDQDEDDPDDDQDLQERKAAPPGKSDRMRRSLYGCHDYSLYPPPLLFALSSPRRQFQSRVRQAHVVNQ